MAKIHINNPKQVINGGAKKYYFKVKGLGGPKGDKGDKGDTGATGPQGPQGNAATISIGSTTTLPVGQDATVENVGTLYNAVLNFGIPQGPRGPQGATGAKGDKGDKGDQGNPGPQGEKGTNATVYVGTTSTLNPGSQATVYNSGTDSNAVLNFGIPKGEKGDTGPMPTIAQTTGQAIDQVMSQKATTDALNTKQATISSSNKLSADLVTDTSTTNKFVTASDITNWNGKQDALTAGTGIDITGGVISTPAIVPEVVTELPTTGSEGKLYLTPKAHTTSTATGNPIEATITAQAGQLESFQLDGDTFQQSYTGKNLTPYPYAGGGNPRGITFTANDDGTVTLNGKNDDTGISNYYLFNGSMTLSAGTYYMVVPPEENILFVVRIGNNYYGFNAENNYRQVFNSSVTISEFYIQVRKGVTTQYNNVKVYPMLSTLAGQTSADYEPFVGGTPSPNPSYPQPIQTVTGEQTVTIAGKNLFDKTKDTVGGYLDSSGASVSANNWNTSGYIKVAPGENYTISGVSTPGISPRSCYYNSSKQFVSSFSNGNQTITIPSGVAYLRLSVFDGTGGDGVTRYDSNTLQLELGSTATTYAPYEATSYPLDLGSLELCKLGTYQDYIWKDGDEWKVHKATAKTTLDSSSFGGWSSTVAAEGYFRGSSSQIGFPSDDCFCNRLSPRTGAHGSYEYIWTQPTNIGAVYIQILATRLEPANISGFNNWINSINPILYYTLTTPTDTVITDQTLIAQLEAIRTALLENGTNTITNTATGTNLAGDMEIGYFGFNPTNRYDKFIWLDLNNNYEQIGGE